MSFDVSAVPIDIWFGIASFCGLEEILCLEATSKLFLEVVSNKLTWLECLHALDQNHAPDLPRHVPLNELSWSDLRTLVVRARRRHLNCSGPAPPRPTREITVPIGSANADGALGKPHGAGADVTLLPGGSFLLVHWSAGQLQCWDVLCGVCVWTYPPPDASGMQTLRVCSFSYDMQPNGDARVLVVSESTNSDVIERTLELFQISCLTKVATCFYKCAPEELDKLHGSLIFSKLCGDVSAAYTEGHLVLTFWEKDLSAVIVEGTLDAIDIVDDYLICVYGDSGSKSVMAVLLSSIRDSLVSTAQASMRRLILNDLPYTRCFIVPPPYLYYHRAMLSVCTSHWKPAAERDGIAITVLLDVYNAETTRDFCMANFFLLESVSDTADAGASGHPRLSHLGLPESIALDQQPNMFSLMSPPSQAGATAISFYNKTLHRDPPEVVRKLATISREKEVVFSSLDLPYAASLSVESYSGALYFPTIDSTSIVIQYFD